MGGRARPMLTVANERGDEGWRGPYAKDRRQGGYEGLEEKTKLADI